jgi:hypothetical protein
MSKVINRIAIVVGLSLVGAAAEASFYQQKGDNKIWYMQGEEYCHVTSPAQLQHLGGTGKVKEVKLSDNIFAGRKKKGECAWPQGFYQVQGDPKIYMIKDEEVCHVQNPDQLKALGGAGDVTNLAHGTVIKSGVKDIGECRWP